MIDYVIRRCGFHECLPIILHTDSGKELYRGDTRDSPDAAVALAQQRITDGTKEQVHAG